MQRLHNHGKYYLVCVMCSRRHDLEAFSFSLSPRKVRGCAILNAGLVALHLKERAVLAPVVHELHKASKRAVGEERNSQFASSSKTNDNSSSSGGDGTYTW